MKQLVYGNNEEKYIKIKGFHAFTLFPKAPVVLGEGNNTYGVVKWTVTKVLEGEVPSYANLTLTGHFYFPLDSGV